MSNMKKFKIGQHIRLKILPNSNIEIIDINNAGYIYMGDAVVNGSIVGQEKKIIPFEYEDDYEVIDFCKNVLNKQDEEKIRELAYKRFPENISYSTIIDKYKDYNLDDRNIFIEGAEQMAAWKDEQLKQFLKDRYNKNLGSINSLEAESIYKELFNEHISEHPMNF